MSEVKLSDQLGAMAIIDDLYQQQIALEEQLNPVGLRRKIAEKIKEYYQSRGMNIQDELIDQGVNEWFSDRLRFQMIKPAWHQRLLAKLYLKRRIFIYLFIAALIALGVYFSAGYMMTRAVKDSIVKQQEIEVQLVKKIAGYQREFDALSQKPLRYATSQGQSLKDEGAKLFVQLREKQLAFDRTLNLSKSSRPALLDQKDYLVAIYQMMEKDDRSLGDILTRYQSVVNNDKRIQQVADARSFELLYQKYQPVRKAFDTATYAVTNNSPTLSADITSLETSYRDALDIHKLALQADNLVSSLNSLVKLPQDKATVKGYADAIQNDLSLFQVTQAKETLQQLEYLKQLAQTSLTLTIVDRVGEKSGVERTYDDSGGKTWYVVVEALTPQGRVFPLWLTDSETGKLRQVTTFGLQVPQSEYLKVRNDKMDDGHIQNNLAGKKPVGSLDFNYARSSNGKIIMEW
ncbi:DUF6384 family protein [Jinshanibacter sp. LJY008]|uniref:DUF6384 family protein n=1 Tax=Limnobaculum eriocheiris TaxID=2897391 RepID=A0A9X1SK88_9GAMM|nr:DUF6384 family protein [Limnobaculum eriocheiris]MCD1125420.1 DUF6384 family protein [Limnobaculum eriocheiris]